jgi:hypothetical protein
MIKLMSKCHDCGAQMWDLIAVHIYIKEPEPRANPFQLSITSIAFTFFILFKSN